jgi:hypothetical protein
VASALTRAIAARVFKGNQMPEKQARAIWPLCKLQVVDITGNTIRLKFLVANVSTEITTIVPHIELYDIRLGDIMPFYTEALLKNAKGNG